MRHIRNWYKLLEGTGLVANDSGPGVAHGTLTPNVNWCPFYSPPYSTLHVAGSLDPDATGAYTYTGYYNSAPYFTNPSGFYLWFSYSGNSWLISQVLGVQGALGWLAWSTVITGTYIHYGTATGDADVASDYIIPYDQKGVIIAASVSRISSAAAAGFPAAGGSIEMLVRPTWAYTDAQSHFFWSTYGGANQTFYLIKNTASATILYTAGSYRGTFSYPWAAHQLYHVVLNWGTNQLYINGSLAYTFTAGGLGSGSSTLYIGDRYTTASYSFSGIIYYFIARDVTLTAAKIAAFNAFFQNLYIPQIT